MGAPDVVSDLLKLSKLNRLRIIFLMICLGLFSGYPVAAQTDTADVNVSISELSYIDAGADVNLTAIVADLNQTYMFSADASTMTLKSNSDSWTLTASLDSAYTDYALYIEDNKGTGDPAGAGFNLIPAAPSSGEMSLFTNYGDAGDYTYDLDWLVINMSWSSSQGDQVRTVTFTLTN
jgi:hypothetical protein